MPLYMDVHHIDQNITQEDLNRAHMKDLEVQDTYEVSHKKYFVNFLEKTVFCLMEGPSKKAVHSCHAEVHGVGPCNIIEVSSLTPTFNFHTIIGDEGGKDHWDVALTRSGEIDTGFRTLMLIALSDFTPNSRQLTKEVYRIIKNNDGNIVQQPDQKILVSFLHAQEGMLCLKTLLGYLSKIRDIDYSLALVTGKPVDDVSSYLFEKTIQQLQTLCLLGQTKMAYVDANTKSLFEKGLNNLSESGYQRIQFVSSEDFSMFRQLKEILEDNLSYSDFRTSKISDTIGLSKTQCYRKIKELTGMSPSGLILEMRLRKSLIDLKNTEQTVSQIAYGQGFNSPNYFTRAFKKRFKLLPTEFANLSA